MNVTVDNLSGKSVAAGLTEKSYAEGMSGNCSNSGTTYVPKHNPALYMWGGNDRQACSADDVPMGSNSSGAFIDDLRARTLPNFSFIAPNLCNDTHDCGVATGDVFLKTLMGDILASSLYRHGHTAVIVVWDEDTPVPNIVVSPSVHPGTVVESTVSHYSLLRAPEDIFGLPRLLSAAAAPDPGPLLDSSRAGSSSQCLITRPGRGGPPNFAIPTRFPAPCRPRLAVVSMQSGGAQLPSSPSPFHRAGAVAPAG